MSARTSTVRTRALEGANRGFARDNVPVSAASFDLDRIGAGLPFSAAVPELQAVLHDSPTAVVEAPPGSGKTTLVPPLVANHVGTGGRILITQPRRVTVRAAARRLAQLDGTPLGERVGHSIRGERRVSERTLVEFVTPGLLLRRLMADPELTGVSAVVLDEVHERQLDTDVLLALLGDVRQLREDLVVVAMSATLDAATFADQLGGDSPAPLVSSPGVLHPLEVRFRPAPVPRLAEYGVSAVFLDHVASTAAALQREVVATDPSTDVLVFVPGAREVNTCAERLRGLLGSSGSSGGVEVLELHGRIDTVEQDRAVSGRGPGDRPRVVVSTALAESSLTVPGVRAVVDTGLSREPRRDVGRGMSGLVTVASSRATGVQRAGRAARLGPGVVVRCFDERTWANAAAHVTPEAATADLAEAALLLAAWGTPRGTGLRFPTPLPTGGLDDAEQTLRELRAIEATGRTTRLGDRLARLPLDPRWGRALLEQADLFGPQVAGVVAAASGGHRPAGADLAALVRSLESGRHPGAATWRADRDRLRRLVAHTASRAEHHQDLLAPVVAAAWPDRVARRVGARSYLLARGTRAALPHDSPLVEEDWLAIAEVSRSDGRDADGTGAVIRAAAALTERAAIEAVGVEQVAVADLSSGRLRARRVSRLGAIELTSTPVRLVREEAEPAVVDALQRHGLGLIGFSAAAQALRRRMAFLHRHLGQPWPAMDEAALLERWPEWLGPEVRRIAEGTALSGVDLAEPLRRLLPWPAASGFAELAPERLRVPSGNTTRVQYPEPDVDGPPVVEVKLQECFGLATSPQIAGVRVQFHLLSPAARPLAVTDDLESFWNGPYAHVRSEMRGRYPKHPWPEDPWNATATHLTKRRAAGR